MALAVAGLAFAGASAWVHYKLLTDPTYISPCNMSASFNCSKVYESRYGSVAGVPVALAGIFWFGLVALVAGLSQPTTGKSSKQGFGATLQVLSFIGLAVVLYLGLTSWFVLKTACVLCIGTYVAVIGIFLTVTKSKTAALSEFGNEIGPVTQKAGVGVALLLAAVGFAAYQFPRQGAPLVSTNLTVEGLTPDVINQFAAAWAKQQRISTGVPADGAQVVGVCDLVKRDDQSSRRPEQRFRVRVRIRINLGHDPLVVWRAGEPGQLRGGQVVARPDAANAAPAAPGLVHRPPAVDDVMRSGFATAGPGHAGERRTSRGPSAVSRTS